jgi:hypothetical protein
MGPWQPPQPEDGWRCGAQARSTAGPLGFDPRARGHHAAACCGLDIHLPEKGALTPAHRRPSPHPRPPSLQAELADARIGVLRLFSPANPTGRYSLQLSHQTHHMVAARLFELYQQQARTLGFSFQPKPDRWIGCLVSRMATPSRKRPTPALAGHRLTKPRPSSRSPFDSAPRLAQACRPCLVLCGSPPPCTHTSNRGRSLLPIPPAAQLDAGLCEWPLVLCINGAALDGRPLDERLLREPHLFRVPREGELAVSPSRALDPPPRRPVWSGVEGFCLPACLPCLQACVDAWVCACEPNDTGPSPA